MKQFTEKSQSEFEQVKNININDNTKPVINEFNGKLDGQNMPVGAMSVEKLINPTATSTSTTKVYGFDWIGETQSYHVVRRNSPYEGVENPSLPPLEFRPILSFDLTNNAWSAAWNEAQELSSDWTDFSLEFKSTAGMLHGCADINFRHGTDIIDDKSNNHVEYGDEQWTRWGVFVNDVLVADTGRLSPRLENVLLPFKIPCGSQPVVIKLKWQTVALKPNSSLYNTPNPKEVLEIFGLQLWCCNTWR